MICHQKTCRNLLVLIHQDSLAGCDKILKVRLQKNNVFFYIKYIYVSDLKGIFFQSVCQCYSVSILHRRRSSKNLFRR